MKGSHGDMEGWGERWESFKGYLGFRFRFGSGFGLWVKKGSFDEGKRGKIGGATGGGDIEWFCFGGILYWFTLLHREGMYQVQ